MVCVHQILQHSADNAGRQKSHGWAESRSKSYARRFAVFTDASSSCAKLVGHVVEPRKSIRFPAVLAGGAQAGLSAGAGCCRAGPEGCGLGSESATFNIGRVIGYRI